MTKYFILLNNITIATTKQRALIYCFLILLNDRYCLFNIHVQVKKNKLNETHLNETYGQENQTNKQTKQKSEYLYSFQTSVDYINEGDSAYYIQTG